MGHKWTIFFKNPTYKFGKKIKTATIHEIQPQITQPLANTNPKKILRHGLFVQNHPSNVCGSMNHPSN